MLLNNKKIFNILHRITTVCYSIIYCSSINIVMNLIKCFSFANNLIVILSTQATKSYQAL